jgi:hypothetical protein
VLGSNLGWDTGYPDRDSCGFTQSLQADARIVRRLDYSRFLPNPSHFIIRQYSMHLTLYSLIMGAK